MLVLRFQHHNFLYRSLFLSGKQEIQVYDLIGVSGRFRSSRVYGASEVCCLGNSHEQNKRPLPACPPFAYDLKGMVTNNRAQ